MNDHEMKQLAEALIPLEVLCVGIRTKPYVELSIPLQEDLLKSLTTLRKLAFPTLFQEEMK